MKTDGIVCFAGNDWWMHNPMTEKQWMRQFAADGTAVLFVNSIGIGMPGAGSPHVARRLLRKLRSLARWLRRDEGVWVLTPLLLPLWSVAPVRRLNLFLLTLQLRHAIKRTGMSRALFWAGIPTAALLLRHVHHDAVVYYVQDNYTAYYDSMSFTRVREDHETLLRAADVVICASVGLAEREAAFARRVEYIPHGVHPAFLEADLDSAGRDLPKALRGIPRPIVGYWGSLEALQDRALVAALARRHPEWSFVFIGRKMVDLDELEALHNVYYPGYLPIEDIPEYGVHFSVGLLSFVQTEWIRYSCPIKFREYLALGLPVVSPPIIEVERVYPGEGHIARTVDEFSAAIREAIETDTPERRRARRALVADESWAASAARVRAVLDSLDADAEASGAQAPATHESTRPASGADKEGSA
ncbi:MAG: glycosyltransferase [Bacteroidetes bacterium]|nr:glycosyltransferase [Bacteroidota bacterium]